MRAYYVPVTMSCMIKCPFLCYNNTMTIVFRLTKGSFIISLVEVLVWPDVSKCVN